MRMRTVTAHVESQGSRSDLDEAETLPRPHRPTFSQELAKLAQAFSDRPTRISEILEATKGRGFDLLLVCISLPLPFSNSSPAWTILPIAAGALERDGAAFLGGCFMFVVTTAYFGLLAFGGAHAIDGLKHAILGTGLP